MNNHNLKIRMPDENDSLSICSLINHELEYSDVNLEELSQRMKRMKEAGNYFTYVAILDQQVIGFIGVVQEIGFEIDKEYYRIVALAVSEAHQNQGVGGALLKFVEEDASSKGISYITLSSNFKRIEAHAFYEHNGYKKRSYTFSKGTK